MNAGDLKKALADVPDDVEILVASDPEGNSFRYLDSVDTTVLVDVEEAGGWEIDSLVDEEDVEDYEDGELIPHVVLWS